MTANDSFNSKADVGYSRRRFLQSSAASGALAAGAAAGLTACTPSWEHKFTPLVPNWMQQLALGVGAEVIKDVASKGLTRLWSSWKPNVEANADEILEDGALVALDAYVVSSTGSRSQASGSLSAAGPRLYIPGGVGWGHPVPPVILSQVSLTRAGDPATDHLVAFVNKGRQYVMLKPWAWQTLLLFVNSVTTGQSGANLDIAKAGCALSLLPSGVRPVSGGSPEGTVDWVTYKTKNGTVEISKVQSSNSTTTGVITASPIQDDNGQPLVMSFGLPN